MGEFTVGDTIWIEDLAVYGVIVLAFKNQNDLVFVCQIGDTGGHDWAAVPSERAYYSAPPSCGRGEGE